MPRVHSINTTSKRGYYLFLFKRLPPMTLHEKDLVKVVVNREEGFCNFVKPTDICINADIRAFGFKDEACGYYWIEAQPYLAEDLNHWSRKLT